jgi:hypothetical protein
MLHSTWYLRSLSPHFLLPILRILKSQYEHNLESTAWLRHVKQVSVSCCNSLYFTFTVHGDAAFQTATCEVTFLTSLCCLAS